MEKQFEVEAASELRNGIIRLIKKLRKESPAGQHLSLTERSTMALLDQHGTLLPGELADMEMITRQSMSQVLNHLFEMDYIIRTESVTDKRKVNISLSAHGKEVLLQFRHQRDEWLANAITEACTVEEQQLLRKVTVPLKKIVDFNHANNK